MNLAPPNPGTALGPFEWRNYPRMNKLTLHFKSSKRHMKASERDELLLLGEIEPINATEYRYIAKPRIMNSFQALANLRTQASGPIRRHLGLSCIFEHAGKRHIEHELTEHDIVLRQSQPISA